jgi:hypothetical protein
VAGGDVNDSSSFLKEHVNERQLFEVGLGSHRSSVRIATILAQSHVIAA